MRAEERIRDVLAKLADTTASVYIVPDFFVFELLHARWTNINGLPAVSVFENPLYGVDGLLKRTADLVLGSLLLAAAAVPMLVIAAADQAHVARARCSSASGGTAWTAARSWSGSSAR